MCQSVFLWVQIPPSIVLFKNLGSRSDFWLNSLEPFFVDVDAVVTKGDDR